jgi:hypothetical protein
LELDVANDAASFDAVLVVLGTLDFVNKVGLDDEVVEEEVEERPLLGKVRGMALIFLRGGAPSVEDDDSAL